MKDQQGITKNHTTKLPELDFQINQLLQQIKQLSALTADPQQPSTALMLPSTAFETPLTSYHEKATLPSDSGDSLLHLIDTLRKEVYGTFIQKSEMQTIEKHIQHVDDQVDDLSRLLEILSEGLKDTTAVSSQNKLDIESL